MTDQPGKPTPKGVRAEELARSGGRDAWALVLAANDIADAIRELTAVVVERFPVSPPAVRVPPTFAEPKQNRRA